MSPRQFSLCLFLSIVCVQESKGCLGRNSPYRGFGVCLNVWDWKCPYEETCIETWKVCDGWADCISRRDEVKVIFEYQNVIIKISLDLTHYIFSNHKTLT